MMKRGLPLAELQEVPNRSLILLTGAPGAGKSTFCHQAVLTGLSLDRPVIFVTTEHGPSEVVERLQDRGLGDSPLLHFVDAFGETVGAATLGTADTEHANCEDLNSISMAIARLQESISKSGILLAFDSLTSPYLFSEKEMFRFMRLCLVKFASRGNSVLAVMDEGCGNEEDLVAMMSLADGILRMAAGERERTLDVVKHPLAEPGKVVVPKEPKQPQVALSIEFDPAQLRLFFQSFFKGKANLRKEMGDFVNLFWPNLCHWSCMLWDPKGFPAMLYELNKLESSSSESISAAPWDMRAFYRFGKFAQSLGVFLPKSFSRVKEMKKAAGTPPFRSPQLERSGILEYLEAVSRTDEHYFRVYENSDCVGFENIGVPTASHIPPMLAGFCRFFEKEKRDWNAIETKCLGLGDPYCEFKVVPHEISDLKPSLEKEAAVAAKIHDRLMDRLMGFLLEGKPLEIRPTLGSDVHLHVVMHGMGYLNLAGERYRRAQMMGAARTGKMIGQRLQTAGLTEDEAVNRVFRFLEHCKVGKISLGETIKMKESCESFRTTIFVHREEPSCFFMTGFLSGFFWAVTNRHVREIKCLAAGDPYCEWEIVS